MPRPAWSSDVHDLDNDIGGRHNKAPLPIGLTFVHNNMCAAQAANIPHSSMTVVKSAFFSMSVNLDNQ